MDFCVRPYKKTFPVGSFFFGVFFLKIGRFVAPLNNFLLFSRNSRWCFFIPWLRGAELEVQLLELEITR